ncbi:MAG TPA: SDR family oxidoreductase [Nitrococcus sp.]|nr:SDR family oxidoreductase [Nitrococcus sp.]
MRKVLIVGATSAIAEATARHFADAGDALFLVGRRADRLQAIAADLGVRGAASVGFQPMDINDLDRHAAMLDLAEKALGGIDTVLIAHGTLADQKACQQDPRLAVQEFGTNAVSTIALLTPLANRLEQQGFGTLAVISSVAGDRGRESNYVYGSAKAALDAFLEGLRQRLHKAGVRVVTIKPGFVDTPMTEAFKKGILWASPERVGKRIYWSLNNSPDIVYAPFYWRYIMLIVRLMPRMVFKAIRL